MVILFRTSSSWTRLSIQRRSLHTLNNSQIRNGSRRRLQTIITTSTNTCHLCCQISSTSSSSITPLNHKQRRRLLSNFPPLQQNHTIEEESVESSSSSTIEEEDGNGDSMIPMIDREVDHEIDSHLSHLRTKLYPAAEEGGGGGNNTGESIAKLYEALSVQEVLDICSSTAGINTHDPIIASQALVTLWDLQKLLFQLGPIFNPNEDFMNKSLFVKDIKENPIFQEHILRPVLEMHSQLQDEPLSAVLLALNKMNYDLHVTEPLIAECVRRKESFCLPGLSRVSVVLRSHGIYGHCALAEFSPIILKYVQSMSDDIEVRLVSILLRNSVRVVSETIFKAYVSRLTDILNSETTRPNNFEVVTYCKMFLVLLDWGKLTPKSLIHKVGYLLRDRVDRGDMELMELLSLQKFCLGPLQEPWSLVESLISRSSRFIEECKERPRMDLISSVGFFMRGSQQKKKLAAITQECMDNNDFASIQHTVFPLLKTIRVDDRKIYDKYWNSAVHLVEDCNSSEYHKTVQLAKNYLNFCHSRLRDSYRNSWLESICKKQLYAVLDLSLSEPPQIIMNPSDFAVTLAFLLAFDQLYLDLKYVSKFEQIVSNIRGPDLSFIAKGIDYGLVKFNSGKRGTMRQKSYEIISEVSSILEEECALRLMSHQTAASDSNDFDLSTVWRILSVIRKMKGESPLLDVGMKSFTSKTVLDSREIREACNAMISGSYFYPEAVDVISEYMFKNLDHVNPETVEKFLNLSYCIGWENDNVDFGRLADVIESNWERFELGVIHCGISLGFHHELRPQLIDKIFNVDFLDHIDEELRNVIGKNPQYPIRLRMNLMELNRIVCLTVPNARLPWFHEKFCQNVLSQGISNPSFLHKDVASVLRDVIGEGVVQSNVCLPQDYYYNIDFVIKFDSMDRPIKTTPPPRALSFSRQSKPDAVSRKVAILVFTNTAFTKNIRVLKGGWKLKRQHLEILGYQVISIDSRQWNSMAFSELAVKAKFLEDQIFNLNK